MSRRILLIAVFCVVLVGALVWSAEPVEMSKGPQFTADGFTLAFSTMDTNSEIDLVNDRESDYRIRLSGTIGAAEELDAVAVNKDLTVSRVVDLDGNDRTVRRDERPGGVRPRFRSGNYNAFHDGVVEVGVPRTSIRCDATCIKTLTLETDVVLAEKRKEVTLPAIVMEDYKNIGHGISVRITNLSIDDSRRLKVRYQYKRPREGTSSPFVESVFAVTASGQELGGGRWTEGDVFGARGYFTAEFMLKTRQVHQSFKMIVVTRSKPQKLTFEVKDIFQRCESKPKGGGLLLP